jgi:hypothetical protein
MIGLITGLSWIVEQDLVTANVGRKTAEAVTLTSSIFTQQDFKGAARLLSSARGIQASLEASENTLSFCRLF